MSLLQAQVRFASLLGKLLTWASINGFTVTVGEVWRNKDLQQLYIQQGKSWTNHSRHLFKLAVDLNLITSHGLTNKEEDYRPLGQFWKSLDPSCVWGGDWKEKDLDHFEFYPLELRGSLNG